VRQDRDILAAGLLQLGFDLPDSQTNFLLTQVPSGRSAEQLYQALKDAGILVRYFATPRLRDSLRITVGTPAQNELLLQELRQILQS